MTEHGQESCLADHERGADPAQQHFQVGDVVYHWRGNGKAKREWAAHWHGPATVIRLQHESLWLALRTTTVKCSKGHVRHATASEQLPLGPMLHALRAPPVPPGRDMQASKDFFMDLRQNAHVTRPAAVNSLISPIQMNLCRELKTSVFRCQELLSNTCQLRNPLFSQCHMKTLHLLHHRCFAATKRCLGRHHFNVFLGGETAPVTPREENSKIAEPVSSFSVPLSHPMPSTSEIPSTLPADPVVVHAHFPTQIDESDKEPAGDILV